MYKVLVIEDEELERTSIKIFLEENIPEIEIVGEAKSGYEALEIIDKNDINLLLVDINIPGIDGIEVIKYARKKLPDAVIIITTAYDDFNIAHRAIKLKVDDFLLKPIRKETIWICPAESSEPTGALSAILWDSGKVWALLWARLPMSAARTWRVTL